jgi:hypothetical protein
VAIAPKGFESVLVLHLMHVNCTRYEALGAGEHKKEELYRESDG